jgi:hypothetical protein
METIAGRPRANGIGAVARAFLCVRMVSRRSAWLSGGGLSVLAGGRMWVQWGMLTLAKREHSPIVGGRQRCRMGYVIRVGRVSLSW